MNVSWLIPTQRPNVSVDGADGTLHFGISAFAQYNSLRVDLQSEMRHVE